jgi:acetolactate synthase-1/3 small subunit
MGEPGTKEVLSLDQLEAVAGLRTGRKHVLSILVENKPGVLTRIAGLFARRGFNIDTLAVGPTDDESISRITLTLDGAVHPIDQVTKQLHKLVNVLKIRDLEPQETLARELAIFKVSADGASRAEVMQICEIFRAKIVDVTKRSVVIEVTGTCDKVDAFEQLGGPRRVDTVRSAPGQRLGLAARRPRRRVREPPAVAGRGGATGPLPRRAVAADAGGGLRRGPDPRLCGAARR